MADQHDVEKTSSESERTVDLKAPYLRDSEPAQTSRTQLEKLGAYNIVVLVMGTILILVPIAFLAFMWSVSINQYVSGSQPSLWIRIVEGDYTARVITLATVVMRAAVAAQLCVFAAIMAALILEQGGAYATDFPLLSMIRCANNGPQALIWHVCHTITTSTGSQLGYSVIIIIAILNAIALQFTSTILLADFGTVDVILGQQHRTIRWGNSDDASTAVFQSSDYWKSGSPTIPAFAEYSEPGSRGSDYIDTGKTYRGFLPFNNSTMRESTRTYEGPMNVVDERVICTKPNMSEVTAYYDDLYLLGGTIDVTDSHKDIVVLNTTESTWDFNCSLPQPANVPNGNLTDWQTAAFCNIRGPPFWMKDGILGNNLPTPGENETWLLGDYEVEASRVWLVMDMMDSGPTSTWEPTIADANLTTLPRLDSPDGPWARYGRDGKNISISACYWAPQTDNYQTTAWNEHGTTMENQVIFWDPVKQEFNTTLARILLNAATEDELKESNVLNSNPESRGLLNLWNNANWTANLTSLKYHKLSYSYLDDQISKEYYDYYSDPDSNNNIFPTYQLSPINGGNYNSIHGLHFTLAQAILKQTNDPARTLQAVTHTILQQIYYEWLPSYDLNATAQFTAIEKHIIPTHWVHFGIVIGLSTLHVVLLVTAVGFFLTRTEMSLLGNAWQVVAQVHSNDTAHAVGKAYVATDKELKDFAKSSGMDRERIRIAKTENGRHEAVMAARPR